jgi:beta-N-acetylhexosaminidase
MTKQPVLADPGVLMLDVAGLELTQQERRLLCDPQVGGVILFARNVASARQVRDLNDAIRACNPALLIAVDQEGGRVQRLREGYTRLPPMRVFAAQWHSNPALAESRAQQCGWLMAAEMLSAGFDFSFAPVLDLDAGVSAVIGDRAFGSEPEQVAALAGAFMRGMREAGMATTGKHFPGHGSVSADSHTDIPVDSRPLSRIRAQDLRPFADCVPLLDAVMPAHVIYEQADARCAGFSPFWLQTVLRGELGFDGVIFSDDLAMAGAAAAGGIDARVDAALDAGCDMVLVCNNPDMALEALAHLHARRQSPSARLAHMRRRHDVARVALLASTRWQQARAMIDALGAPT